jgi:serine/threonine protein kinase
MSPDDPEQGWKLHIPATVLTAATMLRRVGPLLRDRGVLFKATASLEELMRLNSGFHYGYSQVGKFITVYPRTDKEAVRLAERLHELTRGMRAPAVPFDLRYRPGGHVYYRYGAFKQIEVEGGDGEPAHVIRDPEGNLVPDVRDAVSKPVWVADPFIEVTAREQAAATSKLTPLKTTFKAFRALTQRGRGGVYQALDLGATPPRLCVLKEGRRDGEVNWDGRDGAWRVRHEGRVLSALAAAGVNVPRLYASFSAEKNHYIAVEFIEGQSLHAGLSRRRRRFPVAAALRRGAGLARLVASIHAAGWVWRDCKPGNVILSKSGELRPLDFEGACPIGRPDPLPWGTPVFMAPEGRDDFRGQSRQPEDLYALGVVVCFLLTGLTPEAASPPLSKMRRNVPADAALVVEELLSRDPVLRPAAADVVRRLEEALDSQGVRLTRRARSANRGSSRTLS